MKVREYVGCWLHERWRAECALRGWTSRLTGLQWAGLCNRHETLKRQDPGWICQWSDSSWLTVARCFPRVGGRLLRTCLREWPLAWSDDAPVRPAAPRVSVVLPVGGTDRVQQLRATVRAFLAQSEPNLEIIVSEYGDRARLQGLLPDGVVHVVDDHRDGPFNKSVALNRGVAAARGAVVVLHDADVVVPRDYVSTACALLAEGWDAVRPIRWVFHLDAEASADLAGGRLPERVGSIQQNNPGISTVVRRTTYYELGGHDERFVGWGGEDLEFLDRLRTRRLHEGAFQIGLHLWHPPAEQKQGHRNVALLESILGEERALRIDAGRRRLGEAQ